MIRTTSVRKYESMDLSDDHVARPILVLNFSQYSLYQSLLVYIIFLFARIMFYSFEKHADKKPV